MLRYDIVLYKYSTVDFSKYDRTVPSSSITHLVRARLKRCACVVNRVREMGGYGAILKKHGLTKTAAAVEAEGGAAATATTVANGVMSGELMGKLTIDESERSERVREGVPKTTSTTTTTITYSGELNDLTPAVLVRDEGPPATQTKYRGYNTDVVAMKERMLKRHAARGGRDGT